MGEGIEERKNVLQAELFTAHSLFKSSEGTAAYRLLNTAYMASQITAARKEARDRSGVNVLICIHEPSSQNS